jgi:hypothetical protein
MRPSSLQLASIQIALDKPRARTTGRPPARETFFGIPSPVKNASHSPSGEKNGLLASSVSGRARTARSSRERTQILPFTAGEAMLYMYASWRPLREIATPLPGAPGI